MKNYLLFMSFLVMLNFGYSQNSEKVKLSKENQELLKQFEIQKQQRISRIETYLKSNPNTKVTIKDGVNITQIYDIIDGIVLYRSTDNLNAGRATKASDLQPGGSLGLNLDGTGMTVGVWDGGPAFSTHPEFQNSSDTGSRVIIIDNEVVDGDTGGFSSHATHVTGTVSAKGVDPEAKGMAPNINVKSYNWSNDESEMVLAANDETSPIILSNHSYGNPIVNDGEQVPSWFIGAYSQGARNIDNISKNNPKYLIVASAGNSGNYSYPDGLFGGYDKLTGDKNAKNSLIIANASPNLAPFTYNIATLNINSSSSQGPTDDLRVKPDLAADGTLVYSTVPDGGYASFTGTSMASPNTTGTLALLQQYYKQLNGEYMNSATLKALVCHTAFDDSATIGPDPLFGWGFLNAKASAEAILGATTNDAVVDELNLAQGQTFTYSFSAQAGDKLTATICWTDLPGPLTDQTLNNPQSRLVNDLDIRLSKDGTQFLPWKLTLDPSTGFSNTKADNNVDNIERIDIDAPSAGVYTLTVSHKGTLQGNVGGPFDPQTQDYSLVITGNNLTLGAEDNMLSNNLMLFPNPNTGKFTISFDSKRDTNEDVKIDIYDISGRKIYENSFINNSSQFTKTIDLGNVLPGVYLANITSGNRIASQKIIIE